MSMGTKRLLCIGLVGFAGLTALGEKRSDQATLSDVQPTNFGPAKKKHQQYDFSVLTAGRSYSCRTSEDHNTNATNFMVGSTITFVSNGKNGEIKTEYGKTAHCTITRVQDAPATR
jgi:hypothetical protein